MSSSPGSADGARALAATTRRIASAPPKRRARLLLVPLTDDAALDLLGLAHERARDDADPRPAKDGIVPAADVELPLPRRHKDVGRPVVGPGPADELVAVGHAHDHVAPPDPEGIADESPPVGPPGVRDGGAEL